MSDADTIRKALVGWSTETKYGRKHAPSVIAALDALVAERDACRESVRSSGEFWLERVKAAEAERDEALEQRDAALIRASENRQRAEAAEAEVARLEDAIYECLPIIEHGLSGGSAGDALRYVGRKLSPMVAAPTKEDTDD